MKLLKILHILVASLILLGGVQGCGSGGDGDKTGTVKIQTLRN